jgi:heat shock protein HtpX
MYNQIDSNRNKSFLLIAVFIGILAGVGYIYGYYFSDAGPSALILALGISLIMSLVSWFAGDKIALSTVGAQEITSREQAPELWNLIENLSITAGIKMPRLYIVQDPSPNAFATGRDPEHASVAVTTGIIERLNRTELEGVLSHELSHVKNYDSRVMMLAVVLVGAISIIGNYFIRFGFGGRRRRSEGGGILAIFGLIFIVLSPLIAQLMQLAISRRREYLADASGALLTRYPEGLASALEKIRDASIPMEAQSPATNHLWISDPKASFSERVSTLFSTHPPINDRIAKLREMIHN